MSTETPGLVAISRARGAIQTATAKLATIDRHTLPADLGKEADELEVIVERGLGEHRCPACGYTDTCPPQNVGTLGSGPVSSPAGGVRP